MPPIPTHRLGPLLFGEFLTSDNNLSLILRRPDAIERKIDRMLTELRTPSAIGTPWQSTKEGLKPVLSRLMKGTGPAGLACVGVVQKIALVMIVDQAHNKYLQLN